MALDHQGDIEEHTLHTHGVNINEIELESTIQVNNSDTLVLASVLNMRELSVEKRRQVFDSWFEGLAATGAVTNGESKENAKIQRHKAGNFLKVLKVAVGTDFFNKIYYQLTKQLKKVMICSSALHAAGAHLSQLLKTH